MYLILVSLLILSMPLVFSNVSIYFTIASYSFFSNSLPSGPSVLLLVAVLSSTDLSLLYISLIYFSLPYLSSFYLLMAYFIVSLQITSLMKQYFMTSSLNLILYCVSIWLIYCKNLSQLLLYCSSLMNISTLLMIDLSVTSFFMIYITLTYIFFSIFTQFILNLFSNIINYLIRVS